jgi:membrane associated rhomboid family serine protease
LIIILKKEKNMKKLTWALVILGIMWFVFLIFNKNAIPYGINPREINSLKGIIFSTFIHVNWGHLISNTLPIFILTWLLAIFYKRMWLVIWILTTLTGGLLVWLLARGNCYHVGASLTIFALLGFFLASGIFRKEFKAILLAVVVGILYGGALWGIIPSNPNVSWEAHLFGFGAGVFWAYIFRKIKFDDKKVETEKIAG